MSRRIDNRLYYFTPEDESILAETFPSVDTSVYAITYKVKGTDDVFVTTAETKEAMDRHDIPYNLLANEEGDKITLLHTPLSQEELGDYEAALKALALAYRAIALACVGVNGETNLGFDLTDTPKKFTYFTAPAGHTFIWRMFFSRGEARDFLAKLTMNEKKSLDWADAIPLEESSELTSFH